MVMTKNHKLAKELLVSNLTSGNKHPYETWVTCGIPDEDKPQIIEMAKKEVAQMQQPLFVKE